MAASNANVISKQYKSKLTVGILYFDYQIEYKPLKGDEKKKNEDFIVLKSEANEYQHQICIADDKVKKISDGWLKLAFPLSKGVTKDTKLTMIHHRGNKEQELIIFENLKYSELE
ncbi:hypothetical protein MNBD_GAMMA22-2050 [hydrothermal vent metagenome]|uniref:Uncharacterized protein n=1 Tax=hydrothermal vent metagenome TaxID=652676 RepID=A0A3B1AIU9_9ZZZZ